MKKNLVSLFTICFLFTFLSFGNASESEKIGVLENKVDQLVNELHDLKTDLASPKDQLSVLTDEIQKLKMELIVPEEAPKYKSFFGLGPAASKVYSVSKGISLGGYGEAYYKTYVDDKNGKKNTSDFQRFILYAGYKFTDKIILNTEIEWEHGTTGTVNGKSGSASLEFGYLDFLLSEHANIRAGLVLVPMGFVNEMHEPPFFHGNIRPDIETNLIPSTWREMGIGLFGNITDKLQYKLYLVNSLNAKEFGDSKPLRGGRQKGNRALVEDVSLTGSLTYTPIQGLLLGGSFFVGNSGQSQDFGTENLDVFTQVYEIRTQYKHKGFEFRALGTMGFIDDTEKMSADLGKTIGEQFYGWYCEGAYDILPLFAPETEQYFAPFVRFSKYNPQDEVAGTLMADESLDTTLTTIGFSYKPIPNVVIKADYKNYDIEDGKKADEVNLGFGFIF